MDISMLKIDRESKIPIYQQVVRILKEMISENSLKAGDLLPSENELTDILDISRVTVRKALEELVLQGIIRKYRGMGSIIAPQRSEERLFELESFTELAVREGRKPSSVVLEFKMTELPYDAWEAFKVKEPVKVLMLKRVRSLDKVPHILEAGYLNTLKYPELLKVLKLDMSQESLYANMKKFGIKINQAQEELIISEATQELKRLLQIPKNQESLFFRKRWTYFKGDCVEYAETYYRSDRFKFTYKVVATDDKGL